ncbi:MAG: 2-oxoacid:acceptor oxidoreductase family protein [Anaerolineae bacterium]|nr:2-oxoacid:acceptor oxidoreductase family protein [Anaerolineae bacterium]
MSDFLVSLDFPYCKGCGHRLTVRSVVKALEATTTRPLDVVLVTDIGCQGIVDRNFATHTVHGLHGRSVALGAGIAMGMVPGKKVIVFIGDGGATIGLQHLLEMARLNVDMTVVVHNNFVYGMTGGQPSGLTPTGYRTVITPEGNPLPQHNLCQMVHDAGAPYTRRVIGQGDFSDVIRDALEVEGFALIEVLELCPGHGAKRNPGLRLRELAERAGCEPRIWIGEPRPAFHLDRREGPPSLFDEVQGVDVRFASALKGRMAVLVSGSAGEGVQRAAEFLAQAAIACGLHVTKKGSFPVTVGVGFSDVDLVLSRDPIDNHGVSQPDAVIVTSADGLRHNRERIQAMKAGTVWLDASLEAPETGARVRVVDLRGRAGPRSAALYGLIVFAREMGVVPPEALAEVVRESDIGDRVPEAVLSE